MNGSSSQCACMICGMACPLHRGISSKTKRTGSLRDPCSSVAGAWERRPERRTPCGVWGLHSFVLKCLACWMPSRCGRAACRPIVLAGTCTTRHALSDLGGDGACHQEMLDDLIAISVSCATRAAYLPAGHPLVERRPSAPDFAPGSLILDEIAALTVLPFVKR